MLIQYTSQYASEQPEKDIFSCNYRLINFLLSIEGVRSLWFPELAMRTVLYRVPDPLDTRMRGQALPGLFSWLPWVGLVCGATGYASHVSGLGPARQIGNVADELHDPRGLERP